MSSNAPHTHTLFTCLGFSRGFVCQKNKQYIIYARRNPPPPSPPPHSSHTKRAYCPWTQHTLYAFIVRAVFRLQTTADTVRGARAVSVDERRRILQRCTLVLVCRAVRVRCRIRDGGPIVGSRRKRGGRVGERCAGRVGERCASRIVEGSGGWGGRNVRSC